MRWPLKRHVDALERPECAVLAHPPDGPIVRILRPRVVGDRAGASRWPEAARYIVRQEATDVANAFSSHSPRAPDCSAARAIATRSGA